MANPNLPAAGSGLKTQNAVSVDSSKSPGAVMGGGAGASTSPTPTYTKPTGVSTANSVDQTGTGRPVTVNPSTASAGSTGARFIPTSAQQGMANAKTTAQIEAEKAAYKPTGTGGGGGGSSPSGGGSSSPSVDTSYDPYAAENAAAAATTSRIVNGVDMSEKINEANNAWQQATQGYGEQSGGILDQLANATNENINQYQGNAQGIIDQLSNVTGQQLADYAAQTGQTIDQATAQIRNILAGLQDSLKPVEAGRVGRVDTTEQQNILQEMTNNQRQQANQQIDYTVNQGVNELTRALEDAAPQFQAQRNQIAGQERTARDNSALYSEMRGDRGGIGKAQYDAIANTAATNQLKVNQEQTKLSTDTARQIADLRARGEFDKADKMLEISQEYLGKLMQLKQWADDANISIDEFNIGVDQWEQEYNAKLQQTLGELGINAAQYEAGLNLDKQQYLTNQGLNAANTQASQRLGLESDVNKQRQSLNDALAQYGLSNAQYMTNADINRLTSTLNAYMQNAQNMASTELAAANVTGALSDNTLTVAKREAQASRLAQAGAQMLAQGITPTDAQLKALGWSKDQYKGYKAAMDAAAAAAAAAARRGGGRTNLALLWPEIQDYVDSGIKNDEIERRINNAVASGKYSDASQAQTNWAQTSKNYTGWRSLPD